MLKIEKHARGINITEVKENEFKGQYIIEPLYRGCLLYTSPSPRD